MQLMAALYLIFLPFRIDASWTKNQLHVRKVNDVMQDFGLKEWHFADGNVRGLLNQMSVADRSIFPLDVRAIKWDSYLDTYTLGIREHLGKQSPSTLPACRARMNR